jgi:hypothetical protein
MAPPGVRDGNCQGAIRAGIEIMRRELVWAR